MDRARGCHHSRFLNQLYWIGDPCRLECAGRRKMVRVQCELFRGSRVVRAVRVGEHHHEGQHRRAFIDADLDDGYSDLN